MALDEIPSVSCSTQDYPGKLDPATRFLLPLRAADSAADRSGDILRAANFGFRLHQAVDGLLATRHVGATQCRGHAVERVISRCCETCGPSRDRRLKDDGLFLLHTIGTDTPKTAVDPWTDKHIFPGGILPTAARITAAAEGRLVIEDWHNFGRDYDPTLMAWMANVDHHWQELQDLGYGYSWNYRSVCGITLTL